MNNWIAFANNAVGNRWVILILAALTAYCGSAVMLSFQSSVTVANVSTGLVLFGLWRLWD